MQRHIRATRHMRGDQHTLIIPQSSGQRILELADVAIKAHAPEHTRIEGSKRRLLIENFALHHIDYHSV